MGFADLQPWMRFTTGLVVGCWAGVIIGFVIAMLFAGRRIRRLETANLVLRVKIRARERSRRTAPVGAGPVLIGNPGRSGTATGTTSRSASDGR